MKPMSAATDGRRRRLDGTAMRLFSSSCGGAVSSSGIQTCELDEVAEVEAGAGGEEDAGAEDEDEDEAEAYRSGVEISELVKDPDADDDADADDSASLGFVDQKPIL